MATACPICGAGQYQDEKEKPSCKLCAIGLENLDNAATVNKHDAAGDCTGCRSGKYNIVQGAECINCAKGRHRPTHGDDGETDKTGTQADQYTDCTVCRDASVGKHASAADMATSTRTRQHDATSDEARCLGRIPNGCRLCWDEFLETNSVNFGNHKRKRNA